MFQFPRKFPVFTPSSASSSPSTAPGAPDPSVKPDPDGAPSPAGAGAGARKPAAPPAWGRFGSRAEKAARWTGHEGRIGQLRVHRSGKVTLRIEGDLRYEVRFVLSFPSLPRGLDPRHGGRPRAEWGADAR